MIPEDAKLILFGSQARKDADNESDWDLLLLLNKKDISETDYNKYVWPLVQLGWNLGEYFSVKMYSMEDWNKRIFTPFYNNVEQEGVLFY
ncbi:MAG: nucleotidyltransferase domain-containing protein [Bacteroidales bacterium]|nr:nucleotidyltransferase domain-containing protein [Bacteroidales bacterium]